MNAERTLPKTKQQGGRKTAPIVPTLPAATPTAPNGDLMPLLRTAKRLKRSLTPVDPSPTFRAGLEDELLQVARRLARYQYGVPHLIIEEEEPNRPPWIGVGLLLGLGVVLTTALLLSRKSHRK